MIRLFSPQYYVPICRFLSRKIPKVSVVLFVFLACWIYQFVPNDQVQGASFKWIYVHVPAAFASMALFSCVSIFCVLSYIYHIKVARWIAAICAKIGFMCTFLALSSGSVWGYYTWGAWWVWDPRLTTELLLLMLYAAFITVNQAANDHRLSHQVPLIVSLIGLINLPLIHYSVVWWQSLHQGSTLLNMDKQTMPWEMLWPLLLAIVVTALCIASFVARSVLHNSIKKHCHE